MSSPTDERALAALQGLLDEVRDQRLELIARDLHLDRDGVAFLIIEDVSAPDVLDLGVAECFRACACVMLSSSKRRVIASVLQAAS